MSFTDQEIIDIKQLYLEPLNTANLKNRLYKEEIRRTRSDYQRDYTRVTYSPSFRRLQGKMQLLGVKSEQFFRNRLTHSLEVAQIAKSLAGDLGYLLDDVYVVETCALAHDLGNPPFGHSGEHNLHDLCKDIGGFEGNAQTLRILMDLEKKDPSFKGLNVTLRTLLGVTKYFKKYDKINEKFIYDETYHKISEQINKEHIKVRTLDVQIVDLADEIAYAAHDLEDALSLRLFTIDEFLYEFYIDEKYSSAHKKLEEIVNEARNVAMKATIYKSSEEYYSIFRRELTGCIVNKLINDIHLITVTDEDKTKTGTQWNKELGFESLSDLAKGLKIITFKCINRTDFVQLYERQGKKIIEGLFEVYINESCYLPVEFRYNKSDEKTTKKRLVIDYIAGMMDSFAISSYEKFYGKTCLENLYEYQNRTDINIE